MSILKAVYDFRERSATLKAAQSLTLSSGTFTKGHDEKAKAGNVNLFFLPNSRQGFDLLCHRLKMFSYL